MADDVVYWDRFAGGHVRCGDVQRQLAAMRQPALKPLMLEFLDYRISGGAVVCALLREHSCGTREMSREERRQCDEFLRDEAASFTGTRA